MDLVICHYCGALADTKDHFVPVSFLYMIEDFAVANKQIVVPCCKECNSTAGSEVFVTFEEKRLYIRDRYLKKYRRLLESPDWKEPEIEEMGVGLQSNLRWLEEEKQFIRARITRLSRGTKLFIPRKIVKKDHLEPPVREALVSMLKDIKRNQRLF